MMKHEFEVTWFRFEHGHEWDAMTSKSRTFDTYDKAKQFLLKRMQIISGIYWAGGMVEDEKGNIILDITSDGDIEYRSVTPNENSKRLLANSPTISYLYE